MSLHESIFMIEGNHSGRLVELFRIFQYMDTGKDKEVSGADSLSKIVEGWDVGNNRVLKPTSFYKGWTVVIDPEMVMAVDDEANALVSEKFQTKTFGMICEGTSNTYAFSLFDKGRKIRGFNSIDGEIQQSGTPLESESGIDLSKGFLEDEVITIMREETGIDFSELWETGLFLVKELDESGIEIGESSDILD